MRVGTDDERWTLGHVRARYGARWWMRQDASGCWAWRKGEFREEWAATGEGYAVRGATPALLMAEIIMAESSAPAESAESGKAAREPRGVAASRGYDRTQAPPGRAHHETGGA